LFSVFSREAFGVFRYIDNTKIDKKQYYATQSTYFLLVLPTGSYRRFTKSQYSKGFQPIYPFQKDPKNSVNGVFWGVSGSHFGHFSAESKPMRFAGSHAGLQTS